MLLIENIILAINSLFANKMRALLTMLGIIIGIGAVIAIITVGNSLTLSVSEDMQSMGANDVYVMVNPKNDSNEESAKIDGVKFGNLSNSSGMTEDDYITEDMVTEMCEKFKEQIYAINVQYQVGSGVANLGNKSANITLTGNSVGYYVTNELKLLGGHMFSATDFNDKRNVAIVSDKLVNKLFDGDVNKAIGNEIEVLVNDKITVLSIVGVYEYQNTYMMGMNMTGDNVSTDIYIPLKTAMNYNHEEGKYAYLQIITNVGVDANELSARLESFFKPYYKNNRSYEVTSMTLESMVSMLTEMLSTITIAISVIAGIALVVGGIGVMNIMLVSITERTREIGTRKALGAKNSSIRMQFIVEAVIICLVGGALGVLLGIGGGIAASKLLGYPAHPTISSILLSLGFSMSIGIFFGYYPANKAAKMNPIDALRYE